MTNEDLQNKIFETNMVAVRTEGKIDNLLQSLSAYKEYNDKALERVEKETDEKIKETQTKIKEVEGHQWKAVWLGIGAILEGALIWFTGSKH